MGLASPGAAAAELEAQKAFSSFLRMPSCSTPAWPQKAASYVESISAGTRDHDNAEARTQHAQRTNCLQICVVQLASEQHGSIDIMLSELCQQIGHELLGDMRAAFS